MEFPAFLSPFVKSLTPHRVLLPNAFIDLQMHTIELLNTLVFRGKGVCQQHRYYGGPVMTARHSLMTINIAMHASLSNRVIMRIPNVFPTNNGNQCRISDCPPCEINVIHAPTVKRAIHWILVIVFQSQRRQYLD